MNKQLFLGRIIKQPTEYHFRYTLVISQRKSQREHHLTSLPNEVHLALEMDKPHCCNVSVPHRHGTGTHDVSDVKSGRSETKVMAHFSGPGIVGYYVII